MMLLESLTVPKPYHGTSEAFQCEASGVQRHLASWSPPTSSSLYPAHFAHGVYTSPSKFPLNLELNKAVLSLALTPLLSVHTVPSQSITQGLRPPSSSESTSSQKESGVQFSFTHPPFYTPSPMAIQPWGSSALEWKR